MVLNVIGLVIAEAVIAVTTYGLDMKSELAYNAASVVGTGLGTIFRYFAYKKWVSWPTPRHHGRRRGGRGERSRRARTGGPGRGRRAALG